MRSADVLSASLLATLDPEQRAAALLPDGPAQVIAPAGSGKTTTLIARLGVLLDRGTPPDRIGVVTFNRAAALELRARIASRLAGSNPDATRIEVRTLHAMARQVLLDAEESVELLRDRLPVLRAVRRAQAAAALPDEADEIPEPAELDTMISAWKVEGREPTTAAAPLVAAYARALRERGAIDFDDLLLRALTLLADRTELRRRWQARFSHLLVDEFQDVDAAQLRLVRVLAEPERNLFVVGDDDQTIYAWRLADVRRILRFGDDYPGAQRVQLATNYRCPPQVIRLADALISHNDERFAKRIDAAPGAGDGRQGSVSVLSLAHPGWAERIATLAAGCDGGRSTLCVLTRTRSELLPVQRALIHAGIPHACSLPAALDAAAVVQLLAHLRGCEAGAPPVTSLLAARRQLRWQRRDERDDLGDDDHAAIDALIGWSVGYDRVDRFLAAAASAAARLAELRRPDAPVELATVHAAKGREWQTVIVLGMEEERMPNGRSLADAADPTRALEEERRLAYVAVTRATRRLVLAYHPGRPSRFLAEMGLAP